MEEQQPREIDADVIEESSFPGDDIVESTRTVGDDDAVSISTVLNEMGELYRTDPNNAVRSQAFIKLLHTYVGSQLRSRLTDFAIKRGIAVVAEATILGSAKAKKTDIAVIDPENGPLVLIGVRSNMSSVDKNVRNYYEMMLGECISLQHRFPMSTHAYIYLHPLKSIKVGLEGEIIHHQSYAKMYASLTGREGRRYFDQTGLFDHFAYMIVDYEQDPPRVRDDMVKEVVPFLDMRIDTLVNRIVETFKKRLVYWDIFD